MYEAVMTRSHASSGLYVLLVVSDHYWSTNDTLKENNAYHFQERI